MAEEIVRVMRLIIYEGDRDWIERSIAKSIHGTIAINNNNDRPMTNRPDILKITRKITAVTVNEFPEIIKQHESAA